MTLYSGKYVESLEKNSDAIAQVIAEWLGKVVPAAPPGR
jgi:hypothetical protein